MVVLNPRDFQALTRPDAYRDLLASKLPLQTGRPLNEQVESGWRRKLIRWSDERQPDLPQCPRVVVVIDGVNQRPQTDWARIIDAFAHWLKPIGGRLLVTARTTYYETTLQPRLMTTVRKLTVPDWTANERDEILANSGIDHSVLDRIQDANAQVERALCNPRLLGIAIRLVKGRVVSHIEELSVNHLLFEHLRTREQESSTPEPVHECTNRLRIHAQEVLRRLQKGLSDDVTIFTIRDVQTVVDGRYFVPVDGDPTRYALQAEGLVLALGFALIDRLHFASRNNRDLASDLGAVIDPISALDQTAAVLMAALTCTCIDDKQPDKLAVALLCAFAELQNPNHQDLEAFKLLARKRSFAFLEAARQLCLTGWRQANVDWLEEALMSSRRHTESWRNIQDAVNTWLTCYSLEPRPGVRFRGKLSAEERAKEKEKIDINLQSLSAAEARLLANMEIADGDMGALSRLGFTLMPGRPITPFAKSIVRWCLVNMVNQNQGWLYEELEYVVRLNRVDWAATRAAMLTEARILREADASRVGTWALIVLLRATGDPEDASEAHQLETTISDFQPRSWRLLEDYCSSDPCDPSTSKPTNVEGTARRYASIDASSLYARSYIGEGERFLEMARPGVVRFEAEVGVNKHRELVEDVLKRRGHSLRRGLFWLERHSALLTRAMALTLAATSEECLGTTTDVPERDRWWMVQDLLFLAFPKLCAEEQVKALLGTTTGEDVWRSLLEVMKPLDEAVFDRLLGEACRGNHARRQYFLLAFAKGSDTVISRRARDYLASLRSSESALVRMGVFERILHFRDEHLMRLVVDDGWCAQEGKGRNSYENAYGSAILVEGALRNWISVDEALKRISPGHYGWAARRLGPVAGRKVARLMDAGIKASVGVHLESALPEVEYRCRHKAQPQSFPYSVMEKEGQSDVVAAFQKTQSERDEAFEEQERRRHEAFETFITNLDRTNARILVDDITKEEFAAIVDAAPDAAARWYRVFLDLEKGARSTVHNLVVMLAYALRKRYPQRTVALLRAVYGENGPIRFTVGRARVPLEAVVAWSAAESDAGREWCYDRLDLARDDHELAMEVLAALSSREETVLSAFVRERLDGGEPEGIARALLVAGFSSQGGRNREVIDHYRDAMGFIGEAYRAARYAHERDEWTRYWFSKMCEAERSTEFWQYAVLFTKIVDGRFTIWGTKYARQGQPARLFWPSIDGEVNRRIEKWREHRKKTLFGAKRPPDVFLPVVKRGAA